ncbi:MAG: hypothetical protein IPN79_05500 [Saprospiraceae bacterium]|nr:hypothetical protein [Saprospiraceae bacterium]
MNTKIKHITLCFLLTIGILNSLNAQKVEIDFGIGVHLSNVNFHHTSDVNSDDDSEFQAFDNSNFNIGITSPIGNKNWYLKTEIGFIKTNSFFSASYKYDEGFGEKNTTRVTYLTNQKIYLGVLPEYRYDYKSLTLKFTGGVLFSSDIANSYSTSNTVLLPKSKPVGLKMGGAVQYMWDKIGVEFRMSYAKFGQSELQNRWHPKISYDLVLLNWGIVYSL